MSPKPRATEVKDRLVDAAIRLLDDGGPEALQARKLAAEVGVSTMAVYTHFGGMAALVDEVARVGFLRLSAWLGAVTATDDPVADIFSLARTYRQAVAEQPQLFAVTFGQSAPGGKRATLSDLTTEEGREAAQEGLEAFEHIVRATERAIEAGRFRAYRQVPGGGAVVERTARFRHIGGVRALRARRTGYRPHLDTPGRHPRGGTRGHCGPGRTLVRGRESGLARADRKRRAGWERLTRRRTGRGGTRSGCAAS